MSAMRWMVAVIAVVAACIVGGFGALAVLDARQRTQRRAGVLESLSGSSEEEPSADVGKRVLRYMSRMTRALYTGTAHPLAPSVRAGRASQTWAGKRYRLEAVKAGCDKEVSTAAYCETRVRLGVAGFVGGVLVGLLLSTEMAILLGLAGALAGCTTPRRAVEAARKERAAEAGRRLSEMLEVVALGLRSGLSFDLSFALYGSHFDNEFAKSCDRAYRRWTLGLATREEALRDLAASYDCDQLNRVVDGALRSLRLGTALTGTLEEAAEQARAGYRTALEERVAKAPVKMMLPTGTLILPAMLLLVMGPVLLELAGGF